MITDEKWGINACGELVDVRHPADDIAVVIGATVAERDARTRVMSCAPEALRLLLGAEWSADTTCPWCGAWERNDETGVHRDGCPWLALMVKAGLR